VVPVKRQISAASAAMPHMATQSPDGSYSHKDSTPYPKMTRRGPG
jgi:hypothetical protein